jgi:hypothetical protein
MMDKDIYSELMAVAELFGGYAAKDAEEANATHLKAMETWLEGRATGYRLVESHCKRMAEAHMKGAKLRELHQDEYPLETTTKATPIEGEE